MSSPACMRGSGPLWSPRYSSCPSREADADGYRIVLGCYLIIVGCVGGIMRLKEGRQELLDLRKRVEAAL